MTDQTVYLHIGHGRCGSTSIQQFGARNRSALRERGIAYPSAVEMGYPAELDQGGNAQPIFELRKQSGVALDTLGNYLRESDDPSLLLSSEYLYSLPARFHSAVFETCRSAGARVVAIAYVREQREGLISRYAQAVKRGRWTKSLTEYLEERYRARALDYLPHFRRLSKVFGRENLIVRIFEGDRLRKRDVRADLFDLAGVDVSDLIADDPVANASASVEQIEVLRTVNELAGPGEFNPRPFLRRSDRLFAERGWEPTTELHRLAPPSLLQEIADYYAPKNEAFRREFFPDQPSPLFNSKIPDDYEPLREEELESRRSLLRLAKSFLTTS